VLDALWAAAAAQLPRGAEEDDEDTDGEDDEDEEMREHGGPSVVLESRGGGGGVPSAGEEYDSETEDARRDEGEGPPHGAEPDANRRACPESALIGGILPAFTGSRCGWDKACARPQPGI
jgi:hypothetical protein